MLLPSIIFPGLLWKVKTNEKIVYLTFDDGPIPEVTPWVLDTLAEFNAKATFFCVGENALANTGILERIKSENHTVGNHTMHHLNGWKVNDETYLSDIQSCSKYVASGLFRPPYGRIRLSQIRKIKKEFRIVMWDVLSYDFDQSIDGIECFDRVKKKAAAGSIIVFHDSLKAVKRLKYALPATLEYFSKIGFRFEAIR